MQVAASNVRMAMSHQFAVQYDRRLDLGTWNRSAAQDTHFSPFDHFSQAIGALGKKLSSPLQHSEDYQSGRLAKKAQQAMAKEGIFVPVPEDGSLESKQATIIRILENVFGMKGIKQFSLDLNYTSINAAHQSAQEHLKMSHDQQANWGLSYDYQESYREYQATTLAMSGTLTTEDGRAFAFTIDYKMERSLERHSNYSYRAGDYATQKPLIDTETKPDGFGLGSLAAERDKTVGLNLLPEILKNNHSSGKNKTNVFADNSAFFGPQSTNGKIDLMKYDDDGNGVIDSNDAIWKNVRLWTGGDKAPVLLSMWRIAAISLTRIDSSQGNKIDNGPVANKQQSAAEQYVSQEAQAEPKKQVDLVI